MVKESQCPTYKWPLKTVGPQFINVLYLSQYKVV